MNAIGKVSSRIGKRQIIAFLDTGQIDAAYRYAISSGKTNQEVIASAINIVLKEDYNMENILPEGHERLNRRFHGRAKIRMGVTPSRNQTKSFSGWFSRELVEDIARISKENGVNIQTLIEKGIFKLTGIEAYLSAKENETYWDDGVVGD